MKPIILKRQNGLALIMLVLMLMAVGGLLLVGYSQGLLEAVEVKKFKHNTRVLKEAKAALLMYAYNYPENNPGNGPGRMPCPDTDNDGDPNPTAFCKFVVTGGLVGRFPWADPDMNFYDARDATDEGLWYAVSENFANNPAQEINSGSVGSITLVDQSQNIIYDGAVAGIAAIIIAPGPMINRDEDNDGIYEYTQVRGTAAERDDPRNYLDTFNNFDNSVFFNTLNTPPDGFILGPMRETDPASPAVNTVVVNDQMIVITAAEVAAIAEKYVMDAYRTAIIDYLDVAGVCIGPTGGTNEAECTTNGDTWAGVYPWLYDYDVANITELNGFFPADNNFNSEKTNELDINSGSGRIPSMFGPYFSEVNTDSIESKISLNYTGADFLGNITYNQDFPVVATGTWSFSNFIWNGDPTIDGPASINFNIETAEPVTDLRFEDNATVGIVDLIGTIAADESFSFWQSVFWFWRKDASDNWSKCRTIHLIDCHVNSGFIPDPHGPGQQSIEILKVDVPDLFFDSSASDLVQFTFDVSNLTGPPGPLVNIAIVPADNNGHAQITATFGPGEFNTSLLTTITYEYDSDYTDADWDVEASGWLDFSSFPGASVDMGLRYYPELPDWAFDNLWHDSVMLSYALAYRPDNGGPCSEATDCIQLDSFAGNIDNKISILTIAGQNNWIDDGAAGFDDDLVDVFEGENATIANNIFDAKPTPGNDKILIVEECAVAACP